MNKKQTTQVDPAVEEVLASIRHIMAIDLDGPGENQGPTTHAFPTLKKSPSHSGSRENSDILTLTEMVTTDGSVISLSKKGAQMASKSETQSEKTSKEESQKNGQAHSSEPLDLIHGALAKPRQQHETDTKVVSAEDISSLMSPEAVAQSTEAFNDLNKLTADMKQKIQTGTFGTQTIDEMMREMLRPLLKEWLDSHLPSLVKWLVAEKIEQMIREKKGGDK
jgi:cell pole-organizing protein PopZ